MEEGKLRVIRCQIRNKEDLSTIFSWLWSSIMATIEQERSKSKDMSKYSNNMNKVTLLKQPKSGVMLYYSVSAGLPVSFMEPDNLEESKEKKDACDNLI